MKLKNLHHPERDGEKTQCILTPSPKVAEEQKKMLPSNFTCLSETNKFPNLSRRRLITEPATLEVIRDKYIYHMPTCWYSKIHGS